MAMHSIINDVQEGLYSYLITIKQAKPHIHKNTETHTHTQICRHAHAHVNRQIYKHVACVVTYMAMHIYTHTQTKITFLICLACNLS